MTVKLNLDDIQGHIIKAYPRSGYLFGRYVVLEVKDADSGCDFVGQIATKLTTAERSLLEGDDKPEATTNIAFTYQGLQALGVPMASLREFPREFQQGMKARRDILGDDGKSAPKEWDPVWHKPVHMLVTIYGLTENDREERYQWLKTCVANSQGGVEILPGHQNDAGDQGEYQDVAALKEANGQPSKREHFGYTDGISDPVFEGQTLDPNRVIGRGKLNRDGSWAPLATGEFLLGHPDEAEEYPQGPSPTLFSRNGTYMVYRKLHENVATFNTYLEQQAEQFDMDKELMAAKFAGRWRDNGAPIVKAWDQQSKEAWDKKFYAVMARYAKAKAANDKSALMQTSKEYQELISNFDYEDDLDGVKCPLSAHVRRINPRGSLEFGVSDAYARHSALTDRRRILRRGLPYGEVKDSSKDDGNHGIIFIVMNASIERQFEFVQQQWINYGNDFKESNGKEVLLGNHNEEPLDRAVIPAKSGCPAVLTKLPRFVDTRGGAYLFIPSKTAVQLIARSSVDPT